MTFLIAVLFYGILANLLKLKDIKHCEKIFFQTFLIQRQTYLKLYQLQEKKTIH